MVYSRCAKIGVWAKALPDSRDSASKLIHDKRTSMRLRPSTFIVTTRAVGAAAEAKQATEQSSKDAWRNLRHPTIGEYVGLS